MMCRTRVSYVIIITVSEHLVWSSSELLFSSPTTPSYPRKTRPVLTFKVHTESSVCQLCANCHLSLLDPYLISASTLRQMEWTLKNIKPSLRPAENQRTVPVTAEVPTLPHKGCPLTLSDLKSKFLSSDPCTPATPLPPHCALWVSALTGMLFLHSPM